MEPSPPRPDDADRPDRPTLKLTTSGEGPEAPDPRDAPWVADRASALAHEIQGLLDVSMRRLGEAKQSLPLQAVALPLAASVDSARRRMEAAEDGLQRLSQLLSVAMNGESPAGAAAPDEGQVVVALADAVRHAVDVTRRFAEEQGVKIAPRIAPEAERVAVGPVYPALLAGLRNAVESAGSLGAGGHVEVRVDVVNLVPRPWVRIELLDNGPGVSPQASCGNAFVYGMTTREGGAGIGLALAAHTMSHLGGTISLETAQTGVSPRLGAALRMAYPVPASWGPGASG